MKGVGLLLLAIGLITAAIGLALLLAPRVPWFPPPPGGADSGAGGGPLPGDIHWRGRNWSFHFPVATCIVVSIVLTVIVNLVLRLFRR